MNTDCSFRCNCPITTALDILGDKWILVLVKQMLIQQKQSFKDFIDSDEAISTNILTSKLKLLVSLGLANKKQLPHNKKSVFYHLTDKGLSLAPIIIELGIWSSENLVDNNEQMVMVEEFRSVNGNKKEFINDIINSYKDNVLF